MRGLTLQGEKRTILLKVCSSLMLALDRVAQVAAPRIGGTVAGVGTKQAVHEAGKERHNQLLLFD